MRFTTLSTLTSTFFVLTIVLLSPIPVANAQNFNVGFINPQKYVVKELGTSEKITWYVPKEKQSRGSHNRFLTQVLQDRHGQQDQVIWHLCRPTPGQHRDGRGM
jgi:hypothetical protein